MPASSKTLVLCSPLWKDQNSHPQEGSTQVAPEQQIQSQTYHQPGPVTTALRKILHLPGCSYRVCSLSLFNIGAKNHLHIYIYTQYIASSALIMQE